VGGEGGGGRVRKGVGVKKGVGEGGQNDPPKNKKFNPQKKFIKYKRKEKKLPTKRKEALRILMYKLENVFVKLWQKENHVPKYL
jgi:hypothetical protein